MSTEVTLPRPVATTIIGALLGCAAVAWLVIAQHAASMAAMGGMETVAFLVGYLVVWTAAGLVPLGVVQLLGSSIAAPVASWLPRLGGAIVVLAGIYQLTPLKMACL